MSESTFQREDRYIVIKRNDLKKVPVSYRSSLVDPMLSLLCHLPHRECVVVESDWPEYHLVWAMIAHRMAGKPVPDFNLWRRANELQERLTTADQRIDDLETQLAVTEESRRAWFDSSQVADKRIDELTTELAKVRLGPCKMIVGDELP